MTNPVKPTPESLARAKKIYGYDCAICHGANGDGKGDAVTDMKLTMKNYTDPAALKDLTDGELFYIIRNGKGQMPPEEEARAKPDDVWNMVVLVRSFAQK
jgi:mono/diheme cytochrome c family protein